MKKVFIAFMVSGFLMACNNNKETDKTMVKDATDTKSQPAEFADSKYMDMGKQMMQKFESGDIDGWANMLPTTQFTSGQQAIVLQVRKPF